MLADLRRRLAEGGFNDRSPTDRKLIVTYEVSRHTARETVRRLHGEGLVERERGRGTTVRAPAIQPRTGVLYSPFRSIEEQGFEQRSKVLAFERRKDAAAARQLGLAPNATLLYLHRVRFAMAAPTQPFVGITLKDFAVLTGARAATAGPLDFDVAVGTSTTFHTVLVPRHYVLICNLPGHYAAGMRASFTITT